MSYADPALIHTRNYLMGLGIPGNAIGIVGDANHTSGYHLGNDKLAYYGRLHTDYSKRQTDRDRPGSNAAMALDVGGLSGQQLYELTAWLIAQCRAGTWDTRNIREVIGRRSPSGGVTRYDALGILPDSGSADHATHTHISYYRDSEGGDKTSLFRRYFQPPQEDDMAPLVFFAKLAGDPTVRLVSDYMTNRYVTATEFPVLKAALAANNIGTTVWEWPDTPAHRLLFGVNLDPIDDDPAPLLVELSPEQLDELGVTIREGLPTAPTLAEIEQAVDRQAVSAAELGAAEDQ